jgi:hypothetical protein
MRALDRERFEADLAAIARRATPVDLYDRVLRESRRQARRRTALAAAAVAAVVLTGGAATAWLPQPHGGTPPGGYSSSPVPAPSRSTWVSPSPLRSQLPPLKGVKPSLSLGTRTGKPYAGPPGVLYFTTVTGPGGTGTVKAVNSLGMGVLGTRPVLGPVSRYDWVTDSFVFSPDGHSVAWVEANIGNGDGIGPLVVVTDDGPPTVIAARVVGGLPTWMPDSRRIIVTVPGLGLGTLDVTNRRFAPAPAAWNGYVAWSLGGAYVAYGETGKIVVARADGTVVHRVPYDINCCTGGFSVQSVSPDGRYVGVSWENSDPTQVRGAIKLVDVTTGKEVALPAQATGSVVDIIPLVDGLFIRTASSSGAQTARLFAADGHQLMATPLPANTKDLMYQPPPKSG